MNLKNSRYGSSTRKLKSASAGLMTAEELFRLPKGRHRYELLKGELLTMSPSGAEHGVLAVVLAGHLFNHLKSRKLGFLFGAETGFRLQRNPDTVLAPDVAFVRKERLEALPKKYLELAPDLVVEVVSPNERDAKVAKKAALWLQLGVRMVWLVKSKSQTIEVHRLNDIRILKDQDVLRGDEIIPDFMITVADVFDLE